MQKEPVPRSDLSLPFFPLSLSCALPLSYPPPPSLYSCLLSTLSHTRLPPGSPFFHTLVASSVCLSDVFSVLPATLSQLLYSYCLLWESEEVPPPESSVPLIQRSKTDVSLFSGEQKTKLILVDHIYRSQVCQEIDYEDILYFIYQRTLFLYSKV